MALQQWPDRNVHHEWVSCIVCNSRHASTIVAVQLVQSISFANLIPRYQRNRDLEGSSLAEVRGVVVKRKEGQLTGKCRVHAKITLNIARAVPSPPRDATMISTSFTVSSWQLSGDLTTAHYPSPLLGDNSHLVTLTSPNNSASNSRLYNAGCTGEAAQQRANKLQLEAEETVVVQLT